MTIREIAALAGVSPAAVSLVINHKKGVGEETRRRIQGVMDEYGYSPAAPRRQAARFRLMVIKFRAHGIALEENQGFIASIIDRIDSECRRLSFDLVTCNCEAKTAAETFRTLMDNRPDGVIVIGTEMREADYGLLKLLTVPTVVLDNNILMENVDTVVQPDLLVLDEPFKGLDSALRDRMLHVIRDNLPGRSLLMATHSEEEAENLGCEILRYQDGRFL